MNLKDGAKGNLLGCWICVVVGLIEKSIGPQRATRKKQEVQPILMHFGF
jgi:hypothetical protein